MTTRINTNTFNKLLIDGAIGINALTNPITTPKMIMSKIKLSKLIMAILMQKSSCIKL